MPRLHGYQRRDTNTGELTDVYVLETPREPSSERRQLHLKRTGDSVQITLENSLNFPLENSELPFVMDRAALMSLQEGTVALLREIPSAGGVTTPG